MRKSPFHFVTIAQQRIAGLITKPLIRIVFFVPFLLFISTIIGITLLFSRLPPEIPLFYSKPWGEDQLTQPLSLFMLPIGSFLWYLLTCSLVAAQTYKYRVFAQLLLVFSSLVSILSSYTVVTIIRLVI